MRAGQRPLNILLLADDRHPAGAIAEHIAAFAKHSRHHWFVANPIYGNHCQRLTLDVFDMIAIHYSLCVVYDVYLPPRLREKIAGY